MTWNPDEGWYEHDVDGRRFKPHPEDDGHWDHWDIIPPPGSGGKVSHYPEQRRKPWPNQKRPPYGDQSPVDPWPNDGRDVFEYVRDAYSWNLRQLLNILGNVPPPTPAALPPFAPIPAPAP